MLRLRLITNLERGRVTGGQRYVGMDDNCDRYCVNLRSDDHMVEAEGQETAPLIASADITQYEGVIRICIMWIAAK